MASRAVASARRMGDELEDERSNSIDDGEEVCVINDDDDGNDASPTSVVGY